LPPNTPKLLESIGDPVLTVALSFAAIAAKFQASDIAEVSRLAQRVIDLADDPTKGNLVLGSPLASALTFRGARPMRAWKPRLERRLPRRYSHCPCC
jgi:adenylate cyclase